VLHDVLETGLLLSDAGSNKKKENLNQRKPQKLQTPGPFSKMDR
jgi:hypothetical protein